MGSPAEKALEDLLEATNFLEGAGRPWLVRLAGEKQTKAFTKARAKAKRILRESNGSPRERETAR